MFEDFVVVDVCVLVLCVVYVFKILVVMVFVLDDSVLVDCFGFVVVSV